MAQQWLLVWSANNLLVCCALSTRHHVVLGFYFLAHVCCMGDSIWAIHLMTLIVGCLARRCKTSVPDATTELQKTVR